MGRDEAGSQAATLVIRALALGEVTLGDWWRIMRREVMAGLALGAILGSIALQVLVVYLPFMQRAFGTVALSGRDWAFSIAVASSVLWLREISKLFARNRIKISAHNSPA